MDASPVRAVFVGAHRTIVRPPPTLADVLGRGFSIGTVIWIVIGLIVASNEGFLGKLNSLEGVLSAILAVLAWPLVLLDVHVAI
jgi:ABC-type anion transport system duplicated permease subunit